jgi:hypothetical protein
MAADRDETHRDDAAADAKKRRLDKALDKALQDSFPASDPISITQPAPGVEDKEENVPRQPAGQGRSG